MSTNCKSCGKMMSKPEDYSGGNLENPYCSSCTNADGSLKSLDEITLHIVNQLIMSQGIDRDAATKAAKSILSAQPEWKYKISRIENDNLLKTNALIIFLCVSLVMSLSAITLIVLRNSGSNLFRTNLVGVDYFQFSANKLTKYRIMKLGDQFKPVFDLNRKMLFACEGGVNSYMCSEFLDNRSFRRGYVSVIQASEVSEFKPVFTPTKAIYKNFYVILDDNRAKLIYLKNNKDIYVSDINDKNDVAYSNNLIVWIDSNKLYPEYDSIMSMNIQSGMISPIDDRPTKKRV